MFDLNGMTALVTGASGGIGSAIARALAAQGARVALSGSNGAKLRAFREQLIDEVGGDHVEVTCDLSRPESVEELIPATLDTFGQLDILVNNAGITRDNLGLRMKDEEWAEVIQINLEATFRLMRAAAKPMMKARFGRIISVTSIVGVVSRRNATPIARSVAAPTMPTVMPIGRKTSRPAGASSEIARKRPTDGQRRSR